MAVEKVDVDEKEEEGEDYVAVEEGSAPDEKDDTPPADPDDDEDDADDETEGKEARLGGGREEDDDDKQSHRRDENKSRRQRQRDARQRTERELKFLQRRNEVLERRFSTLETSLDARVTGNEVANVDAAINKARSDLTLANQVIAQAVEQNDGKNLAEALEHRDTIRDNLKELGDAKTYLSQPASRGEGARQLDPRHVAHAQKFMTDHAWWDPRGGDKDSQTVLRIDQSLVQEGYNPADGDYWEELRTRTKESVPARFKVGRRAEEDDDADEDLPSKGGNGKAKGHQNKGPQ